MKYSHIIILALVLLVVIQISGALLIYLMVY